MKKKNFYFHKIIELQTKKIKVEFKIIIIEKYSIIFFFFFKYMIF